MNSEHNSLLRSSVAMHTGTNDEKESLLTLIFIFCFVSARLGDRGSYPVNGCPLPFSFSYKGLKLRYKLVNIYH